MGRDIKYEEYLLSGKTIYKCSICDCLFNEMQPLIHHYSSAHTSKKSEITADIPVKDFESTEEDEDIDIKIEPLEPCNLMKKQIEAVHGRKIPANSRKLMKTEKFVKPQSLNYRSYNKNKHYDYK